MFDITSNDFWDTLRKGIVNIFTHPGMEIQLFLSAFAIALALLLSLLLQRMAARRFRPGHKYAWVAGNLLPALLSPFLVIIMLVAAGWVSLALVPIHQRTIAAFIKLAIVWLIARGLLLAAQRHFIAYFISGIMLVLTLLSVTNLLAPTQASLSEITFETSTFHLSLLGAIKGTFTLIVLFWGAGVFSKTGENWVRHFNLSFNARELAIKFLRIFLYFLAFVLTLNQMGVDLSALTVFGGALAVGLGFGLQKITSNFISGIILLFEKTIQAGDLIEVGNEKGWVRQMAIRHTLIETFDGREVLIPNEDLITGKVTSWTYTNRRARIDISVTITYDSDADLAQKLLLAAAQNHKPCITDPAPACYLKEFNDHGIQFLLVFWIADVKDGMAAAKSNVMQQIIASFREAKITFARA